jgi:hypothetical protein
MAYLAAGGNGDIVGRAWIGNRFPGTAYAQLWTRGERIDLTGQIPSDSGWERLSGAWRINNSNVIAGSGSFDVSTRGFIMIPNSP